MRACVRRGGLVLTVAPESAVLRRARWACFAAPVVALSAAVQEHLLRFVSGGGHLIVAASGEHANNVASLMAAVGMRGGHVLRVEGAGIPAQLTFTAPGRLEVEAHIECVRRGSIGDHLAIATVRHGRGWVTWIADSQFVSVQKTEGRSGVWPVNVALIESLFTGSEEAK